MKLQQKQLCLFLTLGVSCCHVNELGGVLYAGIHTYIHTNIYPLFIIYYLFSIIFVAVYDDADCPRSMFCWLVTW